jgi:thiol-disulfide isomerase/thioredoxin
MQPAKRPRQHFACSAEGIVSKEVTTMASRRQISGEIHVCGIDASSRRTHWWRGAPVCALLALVLVSSAAAGPVCTAGGTEASDNPPRTGTLETWRAVKEEGQAAVQVKDLPGRIEKCEAFLKAHPAFEGRKPVLQALVDAYVDSGTFDRARVGQLLEEIAALDPDASWVLFDLLDRYYVRHALPLESGERVLAMARERLARVRAEVPEIETKQWRENREISLKFSEVGLEELDGMLHLVNGDNPAAIDLLAQALKAYEALPHGVLVRAHGAPSPTGDMNAGIFDWAHLGLALAYLRAGNRDLAAQHYQHVVAGFNDQLRSGWDAEIRKGLGLGPRAGTVIAEDPTPAADFTLKSLDGKEVRLSDFRGKVVILDFWATWCHWCLVEMPLLVKFQETYTKDVVLLTINTDRFQDRANIRPVLERLNLDPVVLLEEPEQLKAYDYGALPSLYVVDPAGKLAMAKTGYDRDTREKLSALVGAMLGGKPTPGRTLVTIQTAPQGFGLRWKQPFPGSVRALAIGTASSGEPGQVGVVGPPGLGRWSATGASLGWKPLSGSGLQSLASTDLDGNGTREWVGVDYSTVHVFDTEGVKYWDRDTSFGSEFVRFAPAGGGASQEIIVKASDKIEALGVDSKVLWKTDHIRDLVAAAPDVGDGVVYQSGNVLKSLDARGRPLRDEGDVPAGYNLVGRIAVGGGWLDVFSDKTRRFARSVEFHDVDGDGAKEIVITDGHHVKAFKPDGTLMLLLDTGEVSIRATAWGDLDGKPGDELALVLDKYGLVVLGR